MVYRQEMDVMADLLGADHKEFAKAWAAGATQRIAGVFSSTEVAILHISRRPRIKSRQDCIRRALKYGSRTYVALCLPRPGAVETLSILRNTGYKVGLISNCTEEVSRLWDSTPFAPMIDAAVLSFEVGLAKPDLRIYEIAAQTLGVAAKHCPHVRTAATENSVARRRRG